MPDSSGGLMDRYELLALLGRGGTTEVHRAHDRTLDRTVAVKIFASHLDPAARHRFGHEARALARLSHPGLVTVFDVGTIADRPYLVMQLVDGESLAARLLSGPLESCDVRRLGASLAEALAHAHGRGVVHRDVKPSNILLDGEGRPYLTDFGIALLTGTVRLTGGDEIVGTPAYLAPEQVLGGSIGPAADVFALGLVLLECLTGELEYGGGTRMESALARLHRPPRVPESLPVETASLLRAMTAQEPADRPTAQECVRRLSAESGVRVGSGRRRVVAAVATVVAAATAGTVLVLDIPSGGGSAPASDHHVLVPGSSQSRPPSRSPSAPPASSVPTSSPGATVDQDAPMVVVSPQVVVTKAKGKAKGHYKH